VRHRKIFTALAGAAALAVAAAGCSAPADSGKGSGAAGTTLTLSITEQPGSLDVTKLDLGFGARLWTSIYDNLIYWSPDGELHPAAAESWEYNADGTVLSLKLRPDMVFSNGSPVDAAAVKGTFDRQMELGEANQNAAYYQYFDNVSTDGDLGVVITLTQPDPALLYNLAAQGGVVGDPDTFDSPDNSTDPVGSGPYVLEVEQSTAGAQYVVTKSDTYWDKENVPFTKVTFKIIEDATAALNALLSGQLDVANITTAQMAQVEGAGKQVQPLPAVYNGELVIADRAGEVLPALGDVRVRQALNLIWDRDAMVDKLQSGIGTPIQQQFQPGTDSFVEELEGVYDFDVDKAKALMTEAGYAEGFDISMPSVAGSTTDYEATITQALASINITTTWVPTPFPQFVADVPTEKYPVYFWTLGYSSAPANVSGWLAENSFFNGFKSTDPALDALFAQATSPDPAVSLKAYQDIGRFLSDEAWFAPILTTPQVYGVAPGYEYSTGPNSNPNIRSFSYDAP
jgi:peptide/nickel transport system substrate-binding protein